MFNNYVVQFNFKDNDYVTRLEICEYFYNNKSNKYITSKNSVSSYKETESYKNDFYIMKLYEYSYITVFCDKNNEMNRVISNDSYFSLLFNRCFNIKECIFILPKEIKLVENHTNKKINFYYY